MLNKKKTSQFVRVWSLILALTITVSMVGCADSNPTETETTEPQMAATEVTEVTEVTEETTEVTEEVTEPEETEEATEATEEVTEETTEPEEENATVPTSKPEGNGSGGDNKEPAQTTKPTEKPTEPEKAPETKPTEAPTETQPVQTEPVETKPEVHTHSYSTTKVAPTCTEKGYTLYMCDCGYNYRENENATGHSWGEWTTTKEATTEAEGEQKRTCGGCGTTETQPIAKKPVETLDCAALIAYGNSYAAGLGFNVVGGALPGYYPASTREFTTMEEAKGHVASKVYALYTNLIAAYGTIEGASASVSVVDNGNGTFSITAYYG